MSHEGFFLINHYDVIKWKHFPRYWPFVRGIQRSPVNSPHKGQWRGALVFSLICVWINGWVNNREVGDLRRYCAHYDVTVMRILVCREFNGEMDSPHKGPITHSIYDLSESKWTHNKWRAKLDLMPMALCKTEILLLVLFCFSYGE